MVEATTSAPTPAGSPRRGFQAWPELQLQFRPARGSAGAHLFRRRQFPNHLQLQRWPPPALLYAAGPERKTAVEHPLGSVEPYLTSSMSSAAKRKLHTYQLVPQEDLTLRLETPGRLPVPLPAFHRSECHMVGKHLFRLMLLLLLALLLASCENTSGPRFEGDVFTVAGLLKAGQPVNFEYPIYVTRSSAIEDFNPGNLRLRRHRNHPRLWMPTWSSSSPRSARIQIQIHRPCWKHHQPGHRYRIEVLVPGGIR